MLGQSIGRSRKILKEIIKDQIEPLFRKNSFLRNGNLFYKAEQGMVKVVDLEFFRFNTDVSFFYWFNVHLFGGDFTNKKRINLKLLLTEGAELYRIRIGALWNEEQHMYRITDATTSDQLAQRMRDDLSRYLLPFYEKFHELDDIVKFLINRGNEAGSNDYAYALALMYAKAGQKTESKRFFSESLQSVVNPEIKAAILKTARFYGIDVDSI
jgi:hypothetical protein